jgi:hypothetical protein
MRHRPGEHGTRSRPLNGPQTLCLWCTPPWSSAGSAYHPKHRYAARANEPEEDRGSAGKTMLRPTSPHRQKPQWCPRAAAPPDLGCCGVPGHADGSSPGHPRPAIAGTAPPTGAPGGLPSPAVVRRNRGMPDGTGWPDGAPAVGPQRVHGTTGSLDRAPGRWANGPSSGKPTVTKSAPSLLTLLLFTGRG